MADKSFPNEGKYKQFDRGWNHVGWADEPQYPGQRPLRFPEEWTPLQCFLAKAD